MSKRTILQYAILANDAARSDENAPRSARVEQNDKTPSQAEERTETATGGLMREDVLLAMFEAARAASVWGGIENLIAEWPRIREEARVLLDLHMAATDKEADNG